jgi:hypothetical protein
MVLASLRKKVYSSMLTFVVAVQLLNVSIDAVDPVPHFEDLAINEIESCIELVVEIVLGHGNAIEETDEHDQSSFKPGSGVILFAASRLMLDFDNDHVIHTTPSFVTNTSFKSSLTITIISPPPKVC